MSWRMSSERWCEHLAEARSAGYDFHPKEMEEIAKKVYPPSRMYIAVRAALRRIGAEARARKG